MTAALLLIVAATAGCGRRGEGALVSEGRRVFVASGCGGCHTVASAHTHGTAGPNFDTSEQLTRRQIRVQLNLGEGGMPSYRDRLSNSRQQAVTEFVFRTLHARPRPKNG